MTTLPGVSEPPALAGRTRRRIQAWRQLSHELSGDGYDLAFVTSRPLNEPHRSVGDLSFSHTLLSDPKLVLAEALFLPTGATKDGRDYSEITLLANHGDIFKVFWASPDPLIDILATMRFVRAARG
ncbi:MAG TPA: hypothetical protein VH025_07215 [Solirubrobacteraceae bacterium]|jgi:hypothetical protein|nr:hypothetical protein [Solirubrobacteraceae bacterium]